MTDSGRWTSRWGVVLASALVMAAQLAHAQGEARPEAERPVQVADVERPGSYPPKVRLVLAGALTWRTYCARPGVESCAQYDARPEEERTADTVDFRSRAPYLGVLAELELFPLVERPLPLVRGLGVVLSWQQGFARTRATVSSPTGDTPAQEVFATDTALEAVGAWRYLFDLGQGGSPLWGHAGLRLGARSRSFAPRQQPGGPVPAAHRLYPVAGLDFSVPLVRVVRLEGSVHLLLAAEPERQEEVRGYGQSASSLGWAAELGVAGTVWGPLGYAARVRLERYGDRFQGAGTRRGWEQGGVAEDLYSTAWVGGLVAW